MSNSEKSIEKTILKNTYIESLEVHPDNSRTGISTSIKPNDFGKTSLKIQENGQKHKDTEYRDI